MQHLVWNADPILLQIGPFAIHWYGLFFAGGLLIGYKIMEWIFRREGRDRTLLEPLFFYMVIGTIVGARLAHCLFYEPDYYLAHPLEILYIWKGGLASHGGILGALLALALFCRRYRVSFLWLFSRLAIPALLLDALIRIGNFFNSEILGKVSDLPWAIVFARVDPDHARHPVMLYESAGYLLLFLFVLWLYRRLSAERATCLIPGLVFTLGFAWRFVLEYFKAPQAEHAASLPLGLSMGQLLTIPFFLLGVGLLIWGARREQC